jgi:hypothetical protein
MYLQSLYNSTRILRFHIARSIIFFPLRYLTAGKSRKFSPPSPRRSSHPASVGSPTFSSARNLSLIESPSPFPTWPAIYIHENVNHKIDSGKGKVLLFCVAKMAHCVLMFYRLISNSELGFIISFLTSRFARPTSAAILTPTLSSTLFTSLNLTALYQLGFCRFCLAQRSALVSQWSYQAGTCYQVVCYCQIFQSYLVKHLAKIAA